jgi:hypothetical protein
MAPKIAYPSWCQECVYRHDSKTFTMLTGYCVTDCRCDSCGRIGDLAMIKTTEANSGSKS